MMPDIVFLINGHETNIVDFGIVPVDTIKVMTISVLNKAMPTLYGIEILVDDKDVKVIKAPIQLIQSEKDEVILEYHPTSETETGLKAEIKIKGKYLA